MNTLQQLNIDLRPDQIATFCQQRHIRKLSLFGSVLRNDFQPTSDVDVLIEFEPEARIGLFDMVTMEMELTKMIGRKVDLRTPQELSRYFRQKVVDTALKLYERE